MPVKSTVLAATLGLVVLFPIGVSQSSAEVIGDADGRGPLLTLGPAIGLTPGEITRIRNATGFIRCPGTKYGNESMGSATVVFADDIIVTAAHNLVDEAGRLREPLTECRFVSQAVKEGFYAVPVDGANLFLGAAADEVDNPDDYAVFRLSEPVRGAVPFQLAAGDGVGKEVYTVAAWQDMQPAPDVEAPVVQVCVTRLVSAGGLISDCDITSVASGGAMLVRQDGDLKILGVQVATGNEPNRPFNLATGDFTYSVPVRGKVVEAIRALATGAPLPTGNQLRVVREDAVATR